MKTLIISYLPRGEISKTKILVDKLKEEVKEYEEVNLIETRPEFLVPENLIPYIKRNYMGEELSDEDKNNLSQMDTWTKQFKEADIVVVAFPMYNFSQPAMVKAYFDLILQKGETWDMDEKGYKGLMNNKKALILMSSGGIYEGPMEGYDHAMSLTKGLFQFMAFEDIQGVWAAGINQNPAGTDALIDEKVNEIKTILAKWYN